MTEYKKKGDFDRAGKRDIGGNKKSHRHNQKSWTGHKQNAGHSGHR